jgi:hypothetical protein
MALAIHKGANEPTGDPYETISLGTLAGFDAALVVV